MPTDPGLILQGMAPPVAVKTPQQLQQEAMQRQALGLEVQQRQQAIQQSQALEQDRQLQAAARAKSLAGQDAIGAAIKKYSQQDMSTGEHSIDYQKIADEVSAAGFPTEAASWLDMVGKNREILDKLAASHRSYVSNQFESLGSLAGSATTKDEFVSGVAIAAAHGLIDEQMARGVLDEVSKAEDAGNPDAWKAIANHYKTLAPSYQKSHTPEAQAELALKSAQAAKTQAEVAGTLPETPAQRAQRLNQEATLALNVRRESEVERSNRAKEAANNPLAALTGGGTASGGAQASGQPSAAPAAANSPEGPRGEAFLKTLPPNIASEVKAYAEGRRPFPAGFALKSPYFQSLIQMVGQYDPTFDAVNYNARAKTRADFTSGKSAQTINALNTVIGHLDNLSTAVDNLHNTGSPLLNKPLNMISSTILGRPNVTNFNTVKKAVADEVTRVWRQAGGTEADVKAAGANLDAANSPTQLHEAIAEYGHLLQSKLSALENQYQQGMGTTDTSGMSVVTPQSKTVLSKLEAKAAGQKPATPDGRIRVKGPNGETGTVPKGTKLPAGWTEQ